MGTYETEAAYIDAASELIKILKDNGRPNEAVTVFAMASYIKEIQSKMDIVMQEITIVKEQLDDVQKNQPKQLGEYLSQVTQQMEDQYQEMKVELTEIKTDIKKEASGIVSLFKEKGKKALNNVSEFLKIGEKLEKFRENTIDAIGNVSRTIEKIDAFGSDMREGEKYISNAFRTITGWPEKEQDNKKFSKTELFKKPFVAKKNCLEEILEFTENAISKCELLSSQIKGKELPIKEQMIEGAKNVVSMQKRKGRC